MFKNRENKNCKMWTFFSRIQKKLFAPCNFHKLKKRKNRIKPCRVIQSVTIIQGALSFSIIYYCFHYLLFTAELQSNFHYHLRMVVADWIFLFSLHCFTNFYSLHFFSLNSIVYTFPIREDLCRFRVWKLILCMGSTTHP